MPGESSKAPEAILRNLRRLSGSTISAAASHAMAPKYTPCVMTLMK
jgi:hypothetical protein